LPRHVRTRSQALAREFVAAQCGARTYDPVRETIAQVASTGTLDTDLLNSIANDDAKAVRNAASQIADPSLKWPEGLSIVIEDYVDQLNAYAEVFVEAQSIASLEEFNVWQPSVNEQRKIIIDIERDIRSSLSVGQMTPCQTPQDVESLLARAQSQLTPSVSISCRDTDYASRNFTSMEAAWEALDAGFDAYQCEVSVTNFNLDSIPRDQVKAMEMYREAFKEEGPPTADTYAYFTEECVEGSEWGYRNMKVAQAVLSFCPSTLHKEDIRAYAEGSYIPDDGTYVVGEEIAGGSWQTTGRVSDCYWERTAPNGNILDNNYLTFASGRVTVTIRASDGSFTSEGCGDWKRVG
jgi:hypothetical protein